MNFYNIFYYSFTSNNYQNNTITIQKHQHSISFQYLQTVEVAVNIDKCRHNYVYKLFINFADTARSRLNTLLYKYKILLSLQ